jgi:ketosteroid isomerase-like protein
MADGQELQVAAKSRRTSSAAGLNQRRMPVDPRLRTRFQQEPGPLVGDGVRMLAVDEKRVGELGKRFYRAFLAADGEALAKVVAPEAAWVVRLDTALSGAHVGPVGIAALRRQIDELTARTWRPLREDSFDVATSQWHAVVMDHFLAERGERRLDSHEAVIVAVEEGRITRLFHYLHDPAAFAAFWSR